jgi:hypothetical protein
MWKWLLPPVSPPLCPKVEKQIRAIIIFIPIYLSIIVFVMFASGYVK